MPASHRFRLRRWLIAAAAAVLLLLVAAGAGVALLAANPGWLQPRLEALLAASLGRPVAVRGGLGVDLGRVLRLQARDVHVANAGWGAAPDLATIETVAVTVDLWASLRELRLVVPAIEVARPRLSLERRADGAVNWDLQPPDAAVPDERSELPRLGRLSVTDATVAYRDAAAGIATEGALDRLALEDRGERITLDGTGRVGDQPLRLAGSFGSFAQLADRGTPYPVDLSAELGGVRTALAGTVAEPAKLEGLDLAVRAEAGNLGPVLKAIGLPALPLPATTVAGRLGRSAGSWTLRDIDARSGDLAVTGELGVAIGGPRPKLAGRLRSERIDVAALRRQLAPASEASGTGEDVIPEGRLGLDRLRGIDADIGLAVGTLQAGPLRLAAVELRAVLDAGRLRLDPLGADLAGGRVGGTVAIDASRAPPAVTLDLNAGRLRLERLLAEAGLEGQGKGALSLRLKLAGTGRSPQALARSADGQLTVAMQEGEISMLLVEGLGIDPGDIVGVLLASSKADPLEERYPLACAVLDIDLRGGVAALRAAVIDTPDSVITAKGGADLAKETLDLDLAAHPKDMSLFSARSPVHIGGRFGAVEVDADLTGIAARGAAAVALGVLLTPFAAILPFVDLGGAEDAPCGKLVGEAERRGNAPVQQPKR